jgi:energy-coupling factor transporter ATP-binding protein EcfA2
VTEILSQRQSVPSVFESFNARSLDPQQVARGFVPPAAFLRLVRRGHSIIVGPRGSGKTTLLKMLQLTALETWTHPQAESIRSSVDFTGVFVPTDVMWAEQLAALGNGRLDEDATELFSKSAFATHVLRALVASMWHRVDGPTGPDVAPVRRVKMSRWDEAELVDLLSRAWQLDVPVPRLRSLATALTARMSDLAVLASREGFTGEEGRRQRLAEVRWLHIDFLTEVSRAVESFNLAVDEEHGKWALLFDELELAPAGVAALLLTALRSTDQRLLFKLSYSPVGRHLAGLDSAVATMPTQDFDLIPLYYWRKEDGYRFSEELLERILVDRSRPAELTSVFGASVQEPVEDKRGRGPKQSKVVQTYFESLAGRDRSFRDYLDNRGFSLNELHLVTGDERAATLRKIVGIVAVREAYRGSDDDPGGRGRGRKNPNLFSGIPAILAMLEGNPRWIIGVVNSMLDAADMRKTARVHPAIQSREMQMASERFRSLLRTMSASPAAYGGQLGFDAILSGDPQRTLSVAGLVDVVGRYFSDQIISGPFNPDPHGTFRVDERIPEEWAAILAMALNAGAIVLVPDAGDPPMISSVRGQRFRLSYLLAPTYRLPLRLDKEISLSSIVVGRRAQVDRAQRRPISRQQPPLPLERGGVTDE